MIIPVKPRGRIPAELLEPRAGECRMRGAILLAHVSYWDDHAGAAGPRALDDALPPRWRGFRATPITPGDWVPFALVVEIDKAIARLLAPMAREEVYFELGRRSAERNVAAGLPAAASIQQHFWEGKLHHREFGDFGTCLYEPLEQRALRMEYRDYPVMSRAFCLSGQGFLERSIELLGGREAIVEETSCHCYGDLACVFRVSWE